MSKKISLHFAGKRFDVDVEDEFALFLETQIAKDFNKESNNEIKKLLQAYVRKNHELFVQEKKIEELLAKLAQVTSPTN